MDAELIMTVKQMQDHSAWLDMRKQGIGGSDAGAIMGYNPWTSPFALWMEKTGQAEPEDISQHRPPHPRAKEWPGGRHWPGNQDDERFLYTRLGRR